MLIFSVEDISHLLHTLKVLIYIYDMKIYPWVNIVHEELLLQADFERLFNWCKFSNLNSCDFFVFKLPLAFHSINHTILDESITTRSTLEHTKYTEWKVTIVTIYVSSRLEMVQKIQPLVKPNDVIEIRWIDDNGGQSSGSE